MKPHVALGVVALVAAAALALPADGQEGRGCETDACPGMSVYAEAMDAMQRGQYEEACRKLDASLRLTPSARARLSLARCHEARGELARACHEYDRAAAEARRDNQEELVAEALAAADRLESQLTSVVFTIDERPQDLEITIDGEVMDTRTAFEGLVRLDPGEHRIQATAAGFVAFDTTITGPVGETSTVAIELQRSEPRVIVRSEEEDAPPRTGVGPIGVLGLVLGGVGAAAVVAGGVVQFLHDSQTARIEDDPALCGGQEGCTQRGMEEKDSATEKQLAAGVLFVAGGIVLLTGVAIIAVDVTVVSSGPKKSVWLEPTVGGLRLRGTF